MRAYLCLSAALLLCVASPSAVRAQSTERSLEGMWSDPPVNPEDFLCFGFCTDMGIAHIDALLDDPANDDRPYSELMQETRDYEVMEYIKPRLTPEALKTFPLDPLDNPGYTKCEPFGLAQQMFVPHQFLIHHYPDRIEMRYGEWEARRTVYMDGRAAPKDLQPSRLGYSVGHYEGETLVVETWAISANITEWQSKHSDQLKVTERYSRDGDRMLLTATMEDPWGLREPLQIKKVWSWAPDQEIFPYVNCERPDEVAAGAKK
jgi:hypothetical protein